MRVVEGELLRDRTAERHAEHVGVGDGRGRRAGARPGGPGRASRSGNDARRRLAGPRRVVGDGLDAAALSARSSGSHISMLPPRPMMSSSGRPSPRIETRTRCPSTRTKCRTRPRRAHVQVDVAARAPARGAGAPCCRAARRRRLGRPNGRRATPSSAPTTSRCASRRRRATRPRRPAARPHRCSTTTSGCRAG